MEKSKISILYKDFPYNHDTIMPTEIKGGGGGNMSGLESRVAILESDVKHIQGDVSDIKQDLRDFKKQMHDDLKDINGKISSNFKWILSIFGAGFIILATFSICSTRYVLSEIKDSANNTVQLLSAEIKASKK